MKVETIGLVVSGLLAAGPLCGAVGLGESVLTNADMTQSDGMGERAGWSGASYREVTDSKVVAVSSGDGAFELVFTGPRYLFFRQNMLTLQPGGRYRMSAEVQTAGLAGKAWLMLRDRGYTGSCRSESFPADTKGEWKAVVWEGEILKSPKPGEYVFGIMGNGSADGASRIRVRKLRLEPLTAEAAAASAPIPAQFAGRHYLRIVPIDPLLDRVSAAKGEMTFYWPGEPKCGVAACTLAASLDGAGAKTAKLSADGVARISFGKLKPGAHRLVVSVSEPSGTVMSRNEYAVTAVGPAPEGPAGRRLNNFVTELVNEPLKDGDVRFFRPEDGWVWIAFEGACGEASGRLDDLLPAVVRRRDGEARLETQRFVRAGWHVLHVKGARGGTLRIHAVKPVVGNPFPVKSAAVNFSRRFTYDLPFALRFDGIGVYNCYTGGDRMLFDAFAPDAGYYRERGAWLFGHGGGCDAWNTNRYTRATMYNTIANRSWRQGFGIFVDENSVDVVDAWGHNVERECSVNFSEAVWRMNAESPETPVYTYFSDSNYGAYFRDRKCKTSEIACTVNTGRGTGWVVPESYAPTFADEAASAKWEDYFARFFKSTTDFVPAARGRILPWMATYIGIGFWTSYVQPDADIKRHYSRILRAFATRPEFADIAGIGFGGLGDGEDDIRRWGHLILRHYCLEGRTDDPADRYGFKWNPGFVKNCDFADGLAGWTPEPAAGGAVEAETIAGFGGQQGRQNRPKGVGDGVAVFTSQVAGPNRLVQTLSGLEPGKHYSLQFCVADYRSIKESVAKWPDSAFSATLEGATEVKELRYRQGSQGTWARPIRPYFRLHRYVFRADGPTAKLVFADRADDGRALPAGTKQALNYVIFNPYYLETPEQINDIVDWIAKKP